MGLLPLEFSDCIVDSPGFREKLYLHEKELERTSKSMKSLINDGKELLLAAKSLSKAQRSFSRNLMDFKLETIGERQTDDELIIADSLKEMGRLIVDIEDERDRLLDQAFSKFIPALETFRKEEIGAAKESKKRFDKLTAKFCASLDRYLSLKANKASEVSLQEADAALEMEQTAFYQQSMNHVLLLQQVQEKKKFEFVEVLLTFVYSWLAFYHQGQEVYKDFKPYMTDLQIKLQKMRDHFQAAHQQAEELMNKTLEKKHDAVPMRNKEGYLYLMEKKALTTNWVKHYCCYIKDSKQLQILAYTQTAGGKVNTLPECLTLTSCTRRATETIEKRFCFDITVSDRAGAITAQALNEADRRSWLDIMDGKEPIYHKPQTNNGESCLDDAGFCFITKCISALDKRGLEEQGLYRVVGVNSKVVKLTQQGLDKKKLDKLNLDEESEWEIKTITSAIKNYFRSLPEPLMTYELHNSFMQAAKQQSKTLRIHDIHVLVHQLPDVHFRMLHIIMRHLKKVSEHSSENLMSVANLAVCFGPTLMRPPEETLAAIIDIKFCNVMVEILISNYEKIFNSEPEGTDVTVSRLHPHVPKPERMSENFPANFNPMTSSTSSITSSISSIDDCRTLTPASSVSSMYTSQTSPVLLHRAYTDHEQAVSGSEKFGGRLRVSPILHRNMRPSSSYTGTRSVMSQSMITAASQNEKSDNGENNSAGVVYRHARSSSTSSTDSVDSREKNPYLQARRGLKSVMDGAQNAVQHARSSRFDSSSPVPIPRKTDTKRKVRTLYACSGDNASELTFEPNEIIHNVRTSREVGWLEGTLNGRTGLIPANYVEFLS